MCWWTRTKRSPPLGSQRFYHANSAQNVLLFCPPTWPSCHVVASQESIFWVEKGTEICVAQELNAMHCAGLKPGVRRIEILNNIEKEEVTIYKSVSHIKCELR